MAMPQWLAASPQSDISHTDILSGTALRKQLYSRRSEPFDDPEKCTCISNMRESLMSLEALTNHYAGDNESFFK